MKRFQIYDNIKGFDRYTVIIGKDVYTMSRNAGSPQGACVYHGTTYDRERLEMYSIKKAFKDLPKAVQRKIEELSQ